MKYTLILILLVINQKLTYGSVVDFSVLHSLLFLSTLYLCQYPTDIKIYETLIRNSDVLSKYLRICKDSNSTEEQHTKE